MIFFWKGLLALTCSTHSAHYQTFSPRSTSKSPYQMLLLTKINQLQWLTPIGVKILLVSLHSSSFLNLNLEHFSFRWNTSQVARSMAIGACESKLFSITFKGTGRGAAVAIVPGQLIGRLKSNNPLSRAVKYNNQGPQSWDTCTALLYEDACDVLLL
jgi:hypothetical protein